MFIAVLVDDECSRHLDVDDALAICPPDRITLHPASCAIGQLVAEVGVAHGYVIWCM